MNNKNAHNQKLKKALHLLDNKFKYEIIYFLLEKNMHFGELKENLVTVTQQLLTKLLKQLANHNFISRKQYSGFPRKVEYKLTTFGRSLKPVINSLLKWEEQNNIKINNQIKKKKFDSLYDYF